MAVAPTGQSLLLKRAALSRPSGEWNDDDFDVLAAGIVVGRIMKRRAGWALSMPDMASRALHTTW